MSDEVWNREAYVLLAPRDGAAWLAVVEGWSGDDEVTAWQHADAAMAAIVQWLELTYGQTFDSPPWMDRSREGGAEALVLRWREDREASFMEWGWEAGWDQWEA